MPSCGVVGVAPHYLSRSPTDVRLAADPVQPRPPNSMAHARSVRSCGRPAAGSLAISTAVLPDLDLPNQWEIEPFGAKPGRLPLPAAHGKEKVHDDSEGFSQAKAALSDVGAGDSSLVHLHSPEVNPRSPPETSTELVTDATDAAVAGAKVTITRIDTGVSTSSPPTAAAFTTPAPSLRAPIW